MKGRKMRIVMKDGKVLDIPLTVVKQLIFFGDVFLKINSINHPNKTAKLLQILDGENARKNKIIYTNISKNKLWGNKDGKEKKEKKKEKKEEKEEITPP